MIGGDAVDQPDGLALREACSSLPVRRALFFIKRARFEGKNPKHIPTCEVTRTHAQLARREESTMLPGNDEQ